MFYAHMKENFSFKYLGRLNSFAECLKVIKNLNEDDWRNYKDRKQRGGVAAEYTDTIPIIYSPNPSFKELQHHPMLLKMQPHIDDLLLLATNEFGDVSVRQAMLTRLEAGQKIKRHRDKGPITAKSHRVHLVITTNESCIFTVGSESMKFAPGDVWAIDNVDKYHSVSNDGKTDRIHMIVDLTGSN